MIGILPFCDGLALPFRKEFLCRRVFYTVKNLRFILFLFILLNLPIITYADNDMLIRLNRPKFKEVDLRLLLEKRYSCRSFQDKILKLDDVTSVLWASCGKKQDAVTQATRTVPSAGATNPIELYLIVGINSVERLKDGIYHYLIDEHSLQLVADGDKRAELADACLGQDFIKQAPVSLVITAKIPRTTQRYGIRGERYCVMEVGHACQNAYLAATNLGLATVEVGAFADDGVKRILGLDKDCLPLSVMPIGYPIGTKWEE